MTNHITASDLEFFLAIDRSASLSGAARSLRIEQSTVSRRLTALERRIGGTLFIRSREGVIPTALGMSWRDPALLAEEGVLLAKKNTAIQIGGISGKVSLATLFSVGDLIIAPNLPSLLAKHPQLQLRILASGTVADLSSLEADLALRLFRPTTGDYIARLILKSTLRAFTTPTLLKRIKHLPMHTWRWIGWARPEFAHPAETAWFAEQGIVPQITCLSPTTTIHALRAGVGVGLLGEGTARMFPELVQVHIPSLPHMEINVWLVVRQELRNVPRVAAVWDWIAELSESIKS